jgi:hypothetical protein
MKGIMPIWIFGTRKINKNECIVILIQQESLLILGEYAPRCQNILFVYSFSIRFIAYVKQIS